MGPQGSWEQWIRQWLSSGCAHSPTATVAQVSSRKQKLQGQGRTCEHLRAT